MGQLFAVFSARRYHAWTYGQTGREPCRTEHRDVPLRGVQADRKALSRWEPRRCPSPNRRTGSPFLRFVSMVAVRHWPISAIGAPQPPTWRVEPTLPCGILAKTHLATGKHDSWRRWCRFLAQVSGVFGAGVENGWGPAPLEGVGGRFAVQVPLPKTHLRQGSLGPARGCREKEPGPNPKFAEHVHVPLRPLYGLIRCSASQNCRAEHRDVPLRGAQRGW